MDERKLLATTLDIAQAVVDQVPDWPVHLVDEVTAIVGADTVGFGSGILSGVEDCYSVNTGGPNLSADERVLWRDAWQQYPFFRALMIERRPEATRTSDIVESMLDFRRTRIFAEHFRPRKATFQANFGFVTDDDLAVVGLYRSTRDFTPDEVAALDRCRGPIQAALGYRSSMRRIEATLAANGWAVDAGLLTERQRQVLGLVASGATNAHVASQLHISERTARKHVEDILRRLNVQNRAAAVRWWCQQRVAQSPPAHQTDR